ncbi:ArsA family ATPase [Euzebya tangerina]|uniref:ArsA family ATPase n=1 Tax=Euzebya tangerina TaxID=591198 RepID=UPI001F0B75A5|nr:ArsA family ATPase [Euzebya tangerina]
MLFTGKGGVGKTSVSAATALLCARSGLRTLAMSTDPAHSLADSFDVPLGADPTEVAPGLDAVQLNAQARLEDNWRDIQDYLVALLRWSGIGEVQAEELSVLPGLEEIFSLIDVQQFASRGTYDLIVVDCAPTAETLRLLSLPDALGWYMERIFPIERKVARVVRPVLGQMTSMPLPADALHGSVERLYRNLEDVRDLLADTETTSVRLVTNPERMVIAEARRTYTYLSLFGYHVDAVVVNRLIPDAVTDPWFDTWKARQVEHLATIAESFGEVPLLRAPLFDDEMVGTGRLEELGAELYGNAKPHEMLYVGTPLTFETTDDGWELGVSLPFVAKGEVDAFHRGGELYLKIGAYTRSILLPAALQRSAITRASLDDGVLSITFQTVRGNQRDVPR